MRLPVDGTMKICTFSAGQRRDSYGRCVRQQVPTTPTLVSASASPGGPDPSRGL